ncbi:hypothetical protein ATANTOWER_000106 [Ataeniobius toweri]|uniref:Uncharacterized protein n=1 Tax=Ataeniobius toweri TaxID=208326 RepID=A0ABU7BW38_9TELE|nr:hypothetical protein [Ataeniobius toweri]
MLHQYQKDLLHSSPDRELLGENELTMKTLCSTRGCHSTLERKRVIPREKHQTNKGREKELLTELHVCNQLPVALELL